MKPFNNRDWTPGDAVRFEKTKAGDQGVLIQIQRTASHQGAKRSNIKLQDQLKGTMFEKPVTPQPGLFEVTPETTSEKDSTTKTHNLPMRGQ